MPTVLKIFIGGLLSMIPVAAVMTYLGHGDVAVFVSIEGTAVLMLLLMVYAVFFDSKKRWPGLNWQQRLTKIVWLER